LLRDPIKSMLQSERGKL